MTDQATPGPFVVFVLLISGSLIGCGTGSPAGVSGQVWFEGEPVMTGAIRFTPIQNTAAAGGGAQISEGRFAIAMDDRLQAGSYRVSIAATRATGKKIRPHEVLEGEPETIDEIEQYIPRHYNRKSKLNVKLKPGNNQCDFDLK